MQVLLCAVNLEDWKNTIHFFIIFFFASINKKDTFWLWDRYRKRESDYSRYITAMPQSIPLIQPFPVNQPIPAMTVKSFFSCLSVLHNDG